MQHKTGRRIWLILVSSVMFACLFIPSFATETPTDDKKTETYTINYRIDGKTQKNALNAGMLKWVGGKSEIRTSAVPVNTNIIDVPSDPVWNGHLFAGWRDVESRQIYTKEELLQKKMNAATLDLQAVFDERIAYMTVEYRLYGFKNNEGTTPDRKGIKVHEEKVRFSVDDKLNLNVLRADREDFTVNGFSAESFVTNCKLSNGIKEYDGTFQEFQFADPPSFYNFDEQRKDEPSYGIRNVTITGDFVVVRKYQPINYTVSYDYAGGSAPQKKNQIRYNVLYGADISNKPLRNGYVFTGWKEDGKFVRSLNMSTIPASFCVDSKSADDSLLVKYFKTRKTGNRKLTAVWKANDVRYDIEYVLDGGQFSVGTDKTKEVNGLLQNVNPTSEIYNGSPDKHRWFYVQKPVKYGYTFAGWKISGMDEITHYYYFDGEVETNNTKACETNFSSFYNLRSSSGKVTFTAIWEPMSFEAVYYVDGKKVDTQQFRYDDRQMLFSMETYAKDGFHFTDAEWNSQEDLNGKKIVTPEDVFSLCPKDDRVLNLYANRTENVVFVKIQMNGNEWTDFSSATRLTPELRSVNNNKTVRLSFEKETGVYSARKVPNDVYIVYCPLSSASDEKTAVGELEVDNGDSSFVINYYSVSVEKGEGTESVSASCEWIARNGSVTVNAVPESGYQFHVWEGKINGRDIKADSEETVIENVTSPISLTGKSLMIYTATFNCTTGKNKFVSFTTASDIVAPAAPKRSGHVFAGWKVTKSSDPAWKVGEIYKTEKIKPSAGDVSFTAAWKAREYTAVITHWMTGFKNKEGNDKTKTAVRFLTTEKSFRYGVHTLSITSADTAKGLPAGIRVIKNGGYPKFGTYLNDDTSVNGTVWKTYRAGKKFSDVAFNPVFRFSYEPIDYVISYDYDGGKAPQKANPSSYNVIYGVKFTEVPTREGYTFKGWSIDGKIVEGVNDTALPLDFAVNGEHAENHDFVAALSARTTGNIKVKAVWQKNLPKFISPFYEYSSAYVSSYFGGRESINGVTSKYHGGMDLCVGSSTLGKNVRAIADGTVIFSGWNDYGNCVVIDHGNGIVSLYGHLMCEENPSKWTGSAAHTKNPVVRKGQKVKQGDLIAHAGSTYGNGGYSTGPHLHFEIRTGYKNDFWSATRVNPTKYINFSLHGTF